MIAIVKNLVLGILISIADLVPGISGGTIMILSGKYEDIINYVNDMMKFKFTKKSSKFVFPILFGWIIGITSFVKLITYLMAHCKIEMYGVFSGLIIGGALYLLKEMKKNKNSKSFINVTLSFFISLAIFFALKNAGRLNANVSWWYLIITSLIASSVMPLPGISGSTIFLIFGVYNLIINSLSHLNLSVVFPVILGMIVGWFSSIKILNTLFKKFQSTILEILLGITLAGAFKVMPLSSSIYPYIFVSVGIFASFEIENYFNK